MTPYCRRSCANGAVERSFVASDSADTLLFNGFRLDQRGGILYRSREGTAEVPVAIGGRALRLLNLFVERPGQVISKEAILAAVWPGRVVEEANLNVQVSKLRRILDQGKKDSSCIQNFSGRGYCFVAPVSRIDVEASTAPYTVSVERAQPRPRLSIVVLPFQNFSRDGRDQYLADGITEDLTTNLSRIGDTFVISRGTALAYRRRPVDTKQIGQELGVRYVVDGSVRRSGRRVRVTAQLSDAETDQCVWAERFDRRVSDFFDLQTEIATAIAGSIEPELLRSERCRVASLRPKLDGTYELYQLGLWHLYRYNRDSVVEAEALFRRALSADPQFFQAAALLAITLCNAAYLGWAGDAEANYAEAYELARRAVDLDPRYPAAQFALGLVCLWTQRPDRALSAFRDAIALNPSYAAAHVLLGQMHLYRGDVSEAIKMAERGIRLGPRDPRLFIWLPALSGAYYQLGRYVQAIEPGLRSWDLNRNWPAGLRYATAALAQLDRIAEAESAVRELKLLGQSVDFIEANLRRLYVDGAAVDHVIEGLRKAGLD
jgi:TolB-like protein/Flp pilus assembly protein TadD